MFPRYLARALLLSFISVSFIWLYRRVWCHPSSTIGKGLYSRKNSELGKSLFLADEQCVAAFPGLTKEIKNAVAEGPFDFRRLRDDLPGLVQGRIKHGKVCFVFATSVVLK